MGLISLSRHTTRGGAAMTCQQMVVRQGEACILFCKFNENSMSTF